MESGVRPAIRRARASDLDALEALENEIFALDRLSRRSLAYFIAMPTCALLLSESGDRLDAYALAAFRRNSRIARLYSIAVARHAGGRGLGRQLLSASEEEARRRGCTLMRLEVRPDNGSAVRLYENTGYRNFGRIEDYYEDDTPAQRYEKPLGPTRSSDR